MNSPSTQIETDASGTSSRPHPGFAFGWAVVVFTAIAQFFSVGIGYYTFGVYLNPLTEALGENRFWISLGLSMQTIFMGGLGPWVGKLLSEHSIRTIMASGVGMISLGLVICSQAQNLWHLYFGFGVCVSIGVILTSNLPCNLMLANWFNRRRGMALGLSQAGITVSGVVLVPLATYIVVNHGWRTSFMVFAVLAPLIMLPLIWKFAVKTPQEKGLYPDGDPAPPEIEATAEDGFDWNFRQAIRIRDIWLISLVAGPCYMAIAAIVIALPSHGTDLGLTPMQASTTVLVTTLFGAIAKPLAGTLADYIPKRTVVAIAIGLQIVATAILIVADTLLTISLAGALFGLGYGGIAPLWSLLLAERFGLASFAKVMGVAMPLTMPFSLIGFPLTTLVFVMYGSYVPAFGFLMFGFFLAAFCLWLLKMPSERAGGAEGVPN